MKYFNYDPVHLNKCLAFLIDNFEYLVIIKTQEVILRNTLCSNIFFPKDSSI